MHGRTAGLDGVFGRVLVELPVKFPDSVLQALLRRPVLECGGQVNGCVGCGIGAVCAGIASVSVVVPMHMHTTIALALTTTMIITSASASASASVEACFLAV